MATARADFLHAGGIADDLARFERGEVEPSDTPAVHLVKKLMVAADTVSDEEVAALVRQYGEERLTAMVLLAAYAAFQDRLLLALGIPVEEGGPLPPLDVAFTDEGAAERSSSIDPPPGKPAPVPDRVDDAEWRNLDWDDLAARLERQKARAGRIRVPSWEEVKENYPPGARLPPQPLRIQWSLIAVGYAPELALAWSKCTRTFMAETLQDRVFEESLFWVVTRTIHCFY
jgi:hypothetical protein